MASDFKLYLARYEHGEMLCFHTYEQATHYKIPKDVFEKAIDNLTEQVKVLEESLISISDEICDTLGAGDMQDTAKMALEKLKQMRGER